MNPSSLNITRYCAVTTLVTGRKALQVYSLSNHIGVMTSLNLEATIIGPQINGIGDTGYTSLVDLKSFSEMRFTSVRDSLPFLRPPYQQ